MSSDLNVVALTGRLARDPELRTTSSGTAVLQLRLAYNSRVKRHDEWTDEAGFINAVIFGTRAEGLARLLAKGDKISVAGSLAYSEWENQQGEKRNKTEIKASDIQLLTRPAGSTGESVDLGGGLRGQVISETPPSAPDLSEEIPF